MAFEKNKMPMFHKVSLIVFLIILAIFLSPFLYVEINKYIYEKRVTNYLINEKGYDKSELASVEGVFGFKAPQFYTTVIFENELSITYTYFSHDKVLQFDYEIIDDKHKDIKKEELQNYDLEGSIGYK
ncbi:DUF3139 domain-containing protein [Ornithinibacillus sp. FSL M8-0202]|uniref:DUF3139 domain-containing protein n=1 Tax=unclassified Ornithinibacillus TaxID=2620869 RepID=UPI0030CACE03